MNEERLAAIEEWNESLKHDTGEPYRKLVRAHLVILDLVAEVRKALPAVPSSDDEIPATPLPVVATVQAKAGGIVERRPTIHPDETAVPASDAHAAAARLLARHENDWPCDVVTVARAYLAAEDEITKLREGLRAIRMLLPTSSARTAAPDRRGGKTSPTAPPTP